MMKQAFRILGCLLVTFCVLGLCFVAVVLALAYRAPQAMSTQVIANGKTIRITIKETPLTPFSDMCDRDIVVEHNNKVLFSAFLPRDALRRGCTQVFFGHYREKYKAIPTPFVRIKDSEAEYLWFVGQTRPLALFKIRGHAYVAPILRRDCIVAVSHQIVGDVDGEVGALFADDCTQLDGTFIGEL